MSRKQNKKTKKPKIEDIDPSLLPPEVTHVGPHDPIMEYFSSEDPKKVVEQWAEFYEKRPAIAIRELISALIYTTGAKYEITEKHIKKGQFKEVTKEVTDLLKESEEQSEIAKYISGSSSKVHDFWTDIGNGLIVCKGLYKDEFDVFKDWVINFADCKVRLIREAACAAVFSLTEFLAESIHESTRSLEKLSKSKEKGAVKERQIKDFTAEKENATALSMEFFTSVIKSSFNDADVTIRLWSARTTSTLAEKCPERFENDNFLKYIGNGLQDPSIRLRKEALKLSRSILERAEDDTKPVTSFFKRNIVHIIRCCDDQDNGLVVAAFDLLTEIVKAKMMRDLDKIEGIFQFTADEVANVRNAAGKFFSAALFSEKAKKGKQEELYEKQLRKFAELCGNLSPNQISRSIDSMWKGTRCLQEFELLVQILLAAESPKKSVVFAHMLAGAAKAADDRGLPCAKELTTSVVAHAKELFDKYSKVSEAIADFVNASTHFKLSAIEKAAGSKELKDFLKTLHKLFTKTDNNDEISGTIIEALATWSKSDNTPKKLQKAISDELNKISKEFADETDTLPKLKKLHSILEFVDIDDEDLRGRLKTAADDDNMNIAAEALNCLEVVFKWDIARIKDDPEKTLEYEADFEDFFDVFRSKLAYEDVVAEAAFKGMSTMIALSGFIPRARIEESTIGIFFKRFHELPNKSELFSFLTRPIWVGTVDIKYSAHALWYLQDPDLKSAAREFLSKLNGPINGEIFGELVRTLEFDRQKLKTAFKALTKKVDPRSVIDSWLDENDDSLIPLYAPFLECLSKSDAEFIRMRATGLTKQLLDKRASGKLITAKDCAVKTKKSKNESESENDKESENEEDEYENDDADEDDNGSDVEKTESE